MGTLLRIAPPRATAPRLRPSDTRLRLVGLTLLTVTLALASSVTWLRATGGPPGFLDALLGRAIAEREPPPIRLSLHR